MLSQLSQDQAYRQRWLEERGKRWSRWQRRTAFVVATLGGVAVVASAILQLIHLH